METHHWLPIWRSYLKGRETLMMILVSGMSAMLLTGVTCSTVENSFKKAHSTGISLDGMSAVLLTWVSCSIVHHLMGIYLDGMCSVTYMERMFYDCLIPEDHKPR